MPNYRRARIAGGTYFFTVVAWQRQSILCDAPVRDALREAIAKVRKAHPFAINAWVLLPDHLHCVWTLPDGDADFSMRWAVIKRQVSVVCGSAYRSLESVSASRRRHRESALWQRRFWEHRIRDEADLARHLDYIHYNPVKHRLVERAADWPYSTFHRYVREGVYSPDWASNPEIVQPLSAGE